MTDEPATFLVTYQYVPDMARRRTPYREAHLGWLREHAEVGRLLFAGATRDPVDTGVLVWRAADSHQVRRWLVEDPYAAANLIAGLTVRPIGIAIGG